MPVLYRRDNFKLSKEGKLPDAVANSIAIMRQDYIEEPLGLVRPDWASLFVRLGEVRLGYFIGNDAACTSWTYILYSVKDPDELKRILTGKLHWNFSYGSVERQFSLLVMWLNTHYGNDANAQGQNIWDTAG